MALPSPSCLCNRLTALCVVACLLVISAHAVSAAVDSKENSGEERSIWWWEAHMTDDTITILNLTHDEWSNETAKEERRAVYGPAASVGKLHPWAETDGWDRLDGGVVHSYYLRQRRESVMWGVDATLRPPGMTAGSDELVSQLCVDDDALDDAYFALGVAEGYLTQEAIYNHLHNTLDGPGGLRALVEEFKDEVDDWMRKHEVFLASHVTPQRKQVRQDHAATERTGERDTVMTRDTFNAVGEGKGSAETHKERERTRQYQDQAYRVATQLRGIAYGYALRASQRRAARAGASSIIAAGPRPRKSIREPFLWQRTHSPGRARFPIPTSLEDGLDTNMLVLLNMQAEIGDVIRAILYQKALAADAHGHDRRRSGSQAANSSAMPSRAATARTALSERAQETLVARLRDLERRFPEVMQADHCSALVAIVEDAVAVAHTTWNTYQSMTRIHKHYQLQMYTSIGLHSCRAPGDDSADEVWPLSADVRTALREPRPRRRVSMSSYPGMIHSVDDFYASQARLTIMETSYSLVDNDLYALVTPECVLAFIRVMTANYLAGDIAARTAHETHYEPSLSTASTRTTVDWFIWFGRFNSGTYNNEWMVLGPDTHSEPGLAASSPVASTLMTHRFVVGGSVPAGAVAAYLAKTESGARAAHSAPSGTLSYISLPHRAHQSHTPSTRGTPYTDMPDGLVVFDMTEPLLAQRYWASYNVPAIELIYNIAGTARLKAQCGPLFDHETAPRALAFRDGMRRVRSVADVRRLMRWGPFRHDVYAEIPNCTGANGSRGLSDEGRELLWRNVGPDAPNSTTDRCDPPYSSFLTIAARGDLNPVGGEERYGPCHGRLGHRNHAATDLKMRVTALRSVDGSFDSRFETMHLLSGPPHAAEWLPEDWPDSVAAYMQREYPPFRWSGTTFDPMPPLYGLPNKPYTFPTVSVTVVCNPTSPSGPPTEGTTGRLSPLGWMAVLTLLAAVAGIVVYVLRRRAAQAAHGIISPEEAQLLRGEAVTPLGLPSHSV